MVDWARKASERGLLLAYQTNQVAAKVVVCDDLKRAARAEWRPIVKRGRVLCAPSMRAAAWNRIHWSGRMAERAARTCESLGLWPFDDAMEALADARIGLEIYNRLPSKRCYKYVQVHLGEDPEVDLRSLRIVRRVCRRPTETRREYVTRIERTMQGTRVLRICRRAVAALGVQGIVIGDCVVLDVVGPVAADVYCAVWAQPGTGCKAKRVEGYLAHGVLTTARAENAARVAIRKTANRAARALAGAF